MIRPNKRLQIVIGVSIVIALVSWQIGFGALSFDSLGAEDGGGGRFQIGSGNSFVELNNRAESRNQSKNVDSIEAAKSDEEFKDVIVPFLKQHCYQCHSATEREADRRFDLLKFPFPDDNALIDFQDVLDQLNLGEMPPPSEKQPDAGDVAKVIDWLTAEIEKFQQQREGTGGETVLRRLNRREYVNTISDLLNLDTTSFDPTVGFPADQKIEHFDNQGQALVTSGFLLDQYLKSADKIMAKALPALVKPERQEWRFRGGFQQGEFTGFITDVELREKTDQQLSQLRGTLRSLAKAADPTKSATIRDRAASDFENLANTVERMPTQIRLYEHPRSQRHVGSYGFVSDFENGVPHDGYYLISVEVEALNRVPPYEENYARTRSEEPLILGFVTGDVKEGPLHLPQKIEPELARFELADGKQTVQARVWLNEGTTPRFIYVNGSHRARAAHIEVGTMLMQEAGLKPKKGNDAYAYGLQHAKLPHIRINSVFVRGPIYEKWPTQTQIDLLGGKEFDRSRNRENLTQFLKRAYRREPTNDEVGRILKVIEKRESQGVESLDAYRDGLKAVLCSPGFLYLEEPAIDTDNGKRLSNYAIASRLSYFLWSSMPDERLFSLASAGKLSDPKVLEKEFNRMLADPKSDRFVIDFLASWLNLGALGTAPPDLNAFKEYYIDDLAAAMKKETFLFTRHILDEGLPIDRFINSDFTFVNSGLARLYQFDVTIDGSEYEKVNTASGPRGGLIGQASVLTVTANGVDTSPVVRGVWLLENILGTPPNPPPPDVEPLDPDIRGAGTIREQIEKHRNNPACATCHNKIDPLGFALENFDAIGRFRSNYRGRGKIDPSGKMPNGSSFATVSEFKTALLKQREKFARALIQKLMTYSLGRPLHISDRPEIDAILFDLTNHDSQFRYLIKRIVLSETFVQP